MLSFIYVLQKWSKGKMKEKVNNQVLFDQVRSEAASATHACVGCCFLLATAKIYLNTPVLQSNYDKMKSEVPKYKMITPSILADRLRVGSFCKLLSCCYTEDVPWLS